MAHSMKFDQMGEIIRNRRLDLRMTMRELAERTGVSLSTVQRWEAGTVKRLERDNASSLAAALQLPTTTFNGWVYVKTADDMLYSKRIPILGTIAAGEPIFAQENWDGTIASDYGGDGSEYFALEVKGDSMNAEGIFDGSIVTIRFQPVVNNGEIAAVMVDGEAATIKRFYRIGDTVTLEPRSFNPAHKVQVYELRDHTITVLGKLMESRKTF